MSICGQALAQGYIRVEPKWDDGPEYASAVAEAKRRHYTPAYCAAVVNQEPLPPLSTAIAGSASSAARPASAPVPAPDPLVVSVQTLLGVLGYDPGPPNGFAGPKTGAAIAAYQQSIGDNVDGKPSENLRARLQSSVTRRGPVSPPSKDTDKLSIAAKKPTRPSSSGTGFFINGDIIITNNHVIDGCAELRTRKHGAAVGTIRVVATNRADDLAALRGEKLSDNYLKLRIGVPVKPAEPVLVFGYPLTDTLSTLGNTTLGNVTALTGMNDNSRYIQISAAVQPGNSGGPVLDEAGRLLGVVVGKLDALKVVKATGDIPQNVNFAIRSATLASFLETNRIQYEVASAVAKLPNTQLAEQAEAASVQIQCWK